MQVEWSMPHMAGMIHFYSGGANLYKIYSEFSFNNAIEDVLVAEEKLRTGQRIECNGIYAYHVLQMAN